MKILLMTLSQSYDLEQTELYEHYRIVADPAQVPVRVDKFMCDRLQHSSRSRIQKAVLAGFVHVNDKPVKSNYKVRPNDIVTLMMDRPRHDTSILPEDIPLNVVYEDEDLMVINKPAGLVVHPGVGNFTGTLVNALAYYLRDVPTYDPNDPEVGLVHRIDKDTSGLLVVAKTPEANTSLGKQFFVKTTLRSYNALIWGHLDEPSGTIRGNIARDERDRTKMRVVPESAGLQYCGPEIEGKPAVTHWKVLESFGFVTLVECVLETGRTHQIRAHFTHMKHPLFADEKYGGMEILRGERSSTYKAFIHNCFALCPRQALHAKTLGFTHPKTGKLMTFDSEWPEDFGALINKWRNYANNKAI